MARAKHPFASTPGTSATLIIDSNDSRSSVSMQNHGTVRVLFGKDNTVTPSTAFCYLDPGDSLESADTDDWWGVTASGTGDVRGFEVF